MDKYLHSYSKEEQNRLVFQARLLESAIYNKIDFKGRSKLLEVGSGVGAQTAILLERFPGLKIHCIDNSAAQLDTAKKFLSAYGDRVSFGQGEATSIPLPDKQFDCAFTCWLLEHLSNPMDCLLEIRRLLQIDGVIYCNEPVNTVFHLEPYCGAFLEFRHAFTDYHWRKLGDPFVGIKLGNLLKAAGFSQIETWPVTLHFDDRDPVGRVRYIEYWRDLLLSASDQLLEQKAIDEKLIAAMNEELEQVKNKDGTVILDAWTQARAVASLG